MKTLYGIMMVLAMVALASIGYCGEQSKETDQSKQSEVDYVKCYVQCDNIFELRVNGEKKMSGGYPGTKVHIKTLHLAKGDVITVRADDNGGDVGFVMVGFKAGTTDMLINTKSDNGQWRTYLPEDLKNWYNLENVTNFELPFKGGNQYWKRNVIKAILDDLKITIDTESIWDADNKAIHKKEVWYKEFYTPRGYRTAYLRYIHGMSQNTVDDVAETPAVELKEPEEKKPDDAKVTEKNPKKCTCGYLAIEIDGVLVPVHETNPEVRKRLFPNHPLERGKTGPCPIHDNPENQAKWMKYYGVKNKEVLQKIVDKEVEKEKEEKK